MGTKKPKQPNPKPTTVLTLAKNSMTAQSDGRKVPVHAVLVQTAVFQAGTSEVWGPGPL